MDEKTEEIIQKILDKTEAKREDIEERIEKKQEELSGFITPEGAATIVARNYGITLKKEEPEVRKLRIEDLSEGMSNIDVVGVVSRVFEPRTFDRKDGSKGKVANLTLMDKTGEIVVVLWDKIADLIAEEKLEKGMKLRFKNAYIKKGRSNSLELNVGRRSEIEIDPTGERAQELPSLEDTKIKISDIEPNLEFADVVGRVVAVTSPREFNRADGSIGKVSTMRIADETGQIRVSIWGEKADKTEKIEQGDGIILENASVREGQKGRIELHINWRGRIVRNPPTKEIDSLPKFEKKRLKIEEIEPDMPTLDVAGRVQKIFSPTNFTRKDGSSGKVLNVLLADETGSIRISFWDDMAEDMQNKLESGDLLLIENARSRVGFRDQAEIQVGNRSQIKINPKDIQIGEIQPNKLTISELEEGLDYIEITGRVMEKSEIREFTRSNGDKGRVASLTLGDKTGTCNVTLWGPKTEILDELDVGDVIKISDTYTVTGNYGKPEIHAGNLASFEIDPPEQDIPPIEEIEKELPSKKERIKIEEAKENSQAIIRGTVVKLFNRRPFFNVCPKCGRSLEGDETEILCGECGEVVNPDRKIVLNAIVDDGTNNIRVVFFGKLGEKLLEKSADEIYQILKEESIEEFYTKTNLLGREFTIAGSIRHDDYFDMLELRATEIDFPDPKKEAERILKKIKA